MQQSSTSRRGRLFFVLGIARSGKSFECDKWVNSQFENQYCDPYTPDYFTINPRVVISGDDFRTALHGHKYIPEAEDFVFAAMDVAARALLNRGFDVILDETCTTEATILRYLRIDIDAQPIFIDTPIEVCIERAKAAGKEYLIPPIHRMAKQLETLTKDWDITFERLKHQIKIRQEQDISI